MAKKQPEVLTEEHFAQAAKHQLTHKFSEVELQQIKKDLVGQPVWKQSLSFQELQEGGFRKWGELVVWACLKAWYCHCYQSNSKC